MATLVSFHAHPDDESISTAGTMAKAAAAGHRVALVVATRGEQGEPQPDVLRDGEALWERRVVETQRSAEILGADRVEFLGYEDSGMMGEPTNANPNCFWQADVEQAAEKLAGILREASADVLTIYDDHGGYGHPDHIQVHRVGRRAAELAAVEHVFQSTMNRDHIRELMARRADEIADVMDEEERREAATSDDFGAPADIITHAIDVTDFLDQKRASMEAHRSQIGPDTFFLAMPPDAFRAAFGIEWFIALDGRRSPNEPFGDDLFAGVS